jgi:hypothetical protein
MADNITILDGAAISKNWATTEGSDSQHRQHVVPTDGDGNSVYPPSIPAAGPTMTTLSLTSVAAALPSAPLAGRRAVTVSHAGSGGRLWIGKSNVTINNGLRIEAGMEPQTFPVNGGQIYAAGEPFVVKDRLGTETQVRSLASLGSGVVLAGTYPTGQVYKSTDSGSLPAVIMEY